MFQCLLYEKMSQQKSLESLVASYWPAEFCLLCTDISTGNYTDVSEYNYSPDIMSQQWTMFKVAAGCKGTDECISAICRQLKQIKSDVKDKEIVFI